MTIYTAALHLATLVATAFAIAAVVHTTLDAGIRFSLLFGFVVSLQVDRLGEWFVKYAAGLERSVAPKVPKASQKAKKKNGKKTNRARPATRRQE